MKLLKTLAAIAVLSFNISIAEAAFVVQNTNGVDGFVSGSPSTFTLFSGDNGKTGTTKYYNTFDVSGVMNFSWLYGTSDEASKYDPAGYFLNGKTYLMNNKYSFGYGFESIFINAGDTFGWFIDTVDGEFGRGSLFVTSHFKTSAVPVPAALPLLATGLGLLGIARRRKNV